MATASAHSVAIEIDDDIKARVEHLADVRHRSAHALMQDAISQYVEREEKRDAFRRDTLKAWEQHQATGQHATAAEADAWLAQLEQGNDIEPPECHG